MSEMRWQSSRCVVLQQIGRGTGHNPHPCGRSPPVAGWPRPSRAARPATSPCSFRFPPGTSPGCAVSRITAGSAVAAVLRRCQSRKPRQATAPCGSSSNLILRPDFPDGRARALVGDRSWKTNRGASRRGPAADESCPSHPCVRHKPPPAGRGCSGWPTFIALETRVARRHDLFVIAGREEAREFVVVVDRRRRACGSASPSARR